MRDVVISLPQPAHVELSVVRDHSATARATGGFLNLTRVDLVASFPDGHASEPFSYDFAHREALDAVAICACFVHEGKAHVYLRSAVRPPLKFREQSAHNGVIWEVPAGLIEPGEAPATAAARELHEELGFEVQPSALRPLGHWVHPCPAMCAERLEFFRAVVDPRERKVPIEDGSPLERSASVVAISISAALEACARGAITDAKTEIALHRLSSAITV